MSPRAAVRLAQLGFQRVYDYAGGKSDWLAAGLRVEGAGLDPIAQNALTEPPTCRIDDSIDVAKAQLRDDWPFCVVVDDDRTVLGLLRRGADETTVADAMEPGPTTVRASRPLEALLEALQDDPDKSVPVTDADGRLLGVVDARRG